MTRLILSRMLGPFTAVNASEHILGQRRIIVECIERILPYSELQELLNFLESHVGTPQGSGLNNGNAPILRSFEFSGSTILSLLDGFRVFFGTTWKYTFDDCMIEAHS